MKELFVIGGSLIGVFGTFCGILLKITNGRMTKQFDNIDKQQSVLFHKLSGKVDREACHNASNAINKRMDDLDRHTSEKLDMTNGKLDMAIKLIKENGK